MFPSALDGARLGAKVGQHLLAAVSGEQDPLAIAQHAIGDLGRVANALLTQLDASLEQDAMSAVVTILRPHDLPDLELPYAVRFCNGAGNPNIETGWRPEYYIIWFSTHAYGFRVQCFSSREEQTAAYDHAIGALAAGVPGMEESLRQLNAQRTAVLQYCRRPQGTFRFNRQAAVANGVLCFDPQMARGQLSAFHKATERTKAHGIDGTTGSWEGMLKLLKVRHTKGTQVQPLVCRVSDFIAYWIGLTGDPESLPLANGGRIAAGAPLLGDWTYKFLCSCGAACDRGPLPVSNTKVQLHWDVYSAWV